MRQSLLNFLRMFSEPEESISIDYRFKIKISNHNLSYLNGVISHLYDWLLNTILNKCDETAISFKNDVVFIYHLEAKLANKMHRNQHSIRNCRKSMISKQKLISKIGEYNLTLFLKNVEA